MLCPLYKKWSLPLKEPSFFMSVWQISIMISVQIQKIWEHITSNVVCCPKIQSMNSSSLARLQMMMQFIHLNYTERISLSDIAKAGNVSTSTALNFCKIFTLNLHRYNFLLFCDVGVKSPRLWYLRIASCYALPQSYQVFAYRGIIIPLLCSYRGGS